jgi:hypothetical protein
MPTYLFLNNETGETYEEFMSISELDKYLEEHPNVTQQVTAPALHSGRGLGKPSDGFRDVLKQIKKNANKGITRSTIETF